MNTSTATTIRLVGLTRPRGGWDFDLTLLLMDRNLTNTPPHLLWDLLRGSTSLELWRAEYTLASRLETRCLLTAQIQFIGLEVYTSLTQREALFLTLVRRWRACFRDSCGQ
jgi:hypothetical protein